MLLRSRRHLRPAMLLAAGFLFAGAALWGCGGEAPSTAPDTADLGLQRGGAETELVLSADNAAVRGVMGVQNRHTPDLFRVAGVVGTATGADEGGRAVIKVYTERKLAPGQLPAELEGVKVVEEVTGRFEAHKGGGGGVSHTAKQTPPIQLGTSGGPADDLANGFCCGGTLGALVSGGGNQYVLSNSHVFAGDVVSGGNGRVSAIGDDIVQPGLIDVNCNKALAQVVADLSSLSTLFPPNSTPNIDASIAQVRPGLVRTDGAILEVGTLSSATRAPAVGLAVKKSGRTTGLTRSSISAINATVNVGYSNECSGGSFTKQFTGQIIIANKQRRFQNSGDSGSLLVEDVATNPRAVGLCFAGSSTTAVAGPIGDVLNFFNVSMVGQ